MLQRIGFVVNNDIKILEVLDYLPKHIRIMVRNLPDTVLADVEEIRLRLAKPLCITGCNMEILLGVEGRTSASKKAYIVSEDDLKSALQLICNFSIYSVEEELRNGFVTISGGHRVGVCGRTIIENGKVKTIKDISYMNFRVAKQVIGASDKVVGYLIRSPDSIYNTLIISPPQCGKTTLLRDLVRKLSSGSEDNLILGMKVSVIDENKLISKISFHPTASPRKAISFISPPPIALEASAIIKNKRKPAAKPISAFPIVILLSTDMNITAVIIPNIRSLSGISRVLKSISAMTISMHVIIICFRNNKDNLYL